MSNWLAAADRWQIGNAALATLETATVLAPVEQVMVPAVPATVAPAAAAVAPAAAPAVHNSKITITLPRLELSKLLRWRLPKLELTH